MKLGEFSARTRVENVARLSQEQFDFLIIGGGITGCAVARDAASRGFKVALIEQNDFAQGTSSRSSKLIHGGLRYLEQFEFHLVFEALSERAHLLRSTPHLVRPLQFFVPVYEGDPHSLFELGLGLWLYDILSLFRTPGFHSRRSPDQLSRALPGISTQGLKGGYRYFDASMWDDALTVETARSASQWGAALATYTRALEPIYDRSEKILGFKAHDRVSGKQFEIRAKKSVLCLGPFTDQFGPKLVGPGATWKPWLSPSQGVHLVFDHKRLPVEGAMVMSHPQDGRISFVIPRTDLGAGVTIVGTTDGPVRGSIENPEISKDDIQYLMALLTRYFPSQNLGEKDIVSTYVGVRPLVAPKTGAGSLAQTSREHSIEEGPGGVVLVGGGKYTTHRKMATEIVDFALKDLMISEDQHHWIIGSCTDLPVNPHVLPKAQKSARVRAFRDNLPIHERLFSRYGEEALEILGLDQMARSALQHAGVKMPEDPEGFECLAGQLLFHCRKGMVLTLDDFIRRRVPLVLTRKDNGDPWREALSYLHEREFGSLNQGSPSQGLSFGSLKPA